jgi:hypothetical protein
MIPRPIWREAKIRITKKWLAVLGFDLGNWRAGFAFDLDGFAVTLGPISVGVERDEAEPYKPGNYLDWSFMLWRLVINQIKLDIRLECDLNFWFVGYAMADLHDHGIYIGPFNIQIEYDKFYKCAWPGL